MLWSLIFTKRPGTKEQLLEWICGPSSRSINSGKHSLCPLEKFIQLLSHIQNGGTTAGCSSMGTMPMNLQSSVSWAVPTKLLLLLCMQELSDTGWKVLSVVFFQCANLFRQPDCGHKGWWTLISTLFPYPASRLNCPWIHIIDKVGVVAQTTLPALYRSKGKTREWWRLVTQQIHLLDILQLSGYICDFPPRNISWITRRSVQTVLQEPNIKVGQQNVTWV